MVILDKTNDHFSYNIFLKAININIIFNNILMGEVYGVICVNEYYQDSLYSVFNLLLLARNINIKGFYVDK